MPLLFLKERIKDLPIFRNGYRKLICFKAEKVPHYTLFIYIDTLQGRTDQSCITWSGITIENHHTTQPPPPHLPLQYRAIATIQGRAKQS